MCVGEILPVRCAAIISIPSIVTLFDIRDDAYIPCANSAGATTCTSCRSCCSDSITRECPAGSASDTSSCTVTAGHYSTDGGRTCLTCAANTYSAQGRPLFCQSVCPVFHSTYLRCVGRTAPHFGMHSAYLDIATKQNIHQNPWFEARHNQKRMQALTCLCERTLRP